MKLVCKGLLGTLTLLVVGASISFTQSPTAGRMASGPSSTQSAAQQPGSETPARFEVASVRLSPPNAGFTSINNSGSARFIARNATLQFLVGMAFGVDNRNIEGGPNWFDSQRYDIEAKAEGDTPLTPKQFQPLLQQLLKDRFHLAIHHETAERPGYDLVLAKNGPQLRPGKTPARMGFITNGRIWFESASMESLAHALPSVVGGPVADKTGIKGEYRLDLKFAPVDANDSSLPSVFTALEEDLGLKLVRDSKVPVDILVIDHVEKIPTED